MVSNSTMLRELLVFVNVTYRALEAHPRGQLRPIILQIAVPPQLVAVLTTI